jgi:hypothetical protein
MTKFDCDDKNDPRWPIWQRLYDCLTTTKFKAGKKWFMFSGEAWNVCGIAGLDSVGVKQSIDNLMSAARPGREGEILSICADLGQWWLDQPCNARHLCRSFVQRSIDGLLLMASRFQHQALTA